MAEIKRTGIGVSPGIVIGPVARRSHAAQTVQPRSLRESEIAPELQRFRRALGTAEKRIAKLAEQVAERLGTESAGIFEAHLMILKDPMLLEPVEQMIRDERVNADYALHQHLEELARQFRNTKEEFIRQRVDDVHDVGRRLIETLQGRRRRRVRQPDKPVILIADDLSPSETALLDATQVLALITEKGSQASHTTILCRSVGVPAIVGAEGILEVVKDGDLVILDGTSGKIFINPNARTTSRFRKARQVFLGFEEELQGLRDEPCITKDGHEIELSANLELPVELNQVLKAGSRGVGLFRTEYLYLASRTMPGEKLQEKEYRRAAEAVHPDPLVIRTFDLGGDKQPAGMEFPQEANPFLGWRAIRVSLDRPRLFRTQLRAILKASTVGNVRIMFPMISGKAELERVLEVFEDVKEELRQSGEDFDENIRTGIMIELPSAVLCATELAPMVDFFSIGTNDLTQYMLAVDRNNKLVARLFRSMHPAVLRGIAMTVDAARNAGIQVGLCGEMAGDPTVTMLLVGMKLDELSVSPVILPEIKLLVRSMSLEEAEQFTARVLTMEKADSILQACREHMSARFPDLPIWAENIVSSGTRN